MNFSHNIAFSRNIGWLTQDEMNCLKSKRVAIAGLGGVGGSHLIVLSRLGIQNFNISDYDQFALENFNRQAGAKISTIGKNKLDTLKNQALDINPDISFNLFEKGIDETNVEEFLKNVDIYVDGLDFFAFDARILVFKECLKKGIPVITVAPLGMGAALINFIPGKMSFEDYFGMDRSFSTKDNAVRFATGLAPSFLHMNYLVDKTAVSLKDKKGPSTPMACYICSGIAGVETLKILLKRGKITAAPLGIHFDAYRQKMKKTYVPFGFKNPLQALKRYIIHKNLQ